MRNLILTAIAVMAIAGPAVSVSAQAHKKAPVPKKAALVCPVTGDKIKSVKSAVGHSTYKGKTYYFCCGMCKPRFDKAPGKFIANAAKGKFEKM